MVGNDRKLDKPMNIVLYTNRVLDFRFGGFSPNPYPSTANARAVGAENRVRRLHLQQTQQPLPGRQAFGGDGTRYPISRLCPRGLGRTRNGTAPSVDRGGVVPSYHMATGLPYDLLSPCTCCTCASLLFCLIISERLKSSNLGSITLLLTVGLLIPAPSGYL